MRRLTVLILSAVLLVGLAAPAYAGGRHHGGGNRHHGGSGRHHNHSGNTTANIALGLGAFAVLNQMVGFTDHRWRHQTFIYEQPVYLAPAPVVYQSSPVVYYAQPSIVVNPPPVIYPHGRYEFTGAQWVWIPNTLQPPPPAAEPCRYTGRTVRTPQGVLPECQ